MPKREVSRESRLIIEKIESAIRNDEKIELEYDQTPLVTTVNPTLLIQEIARHSQTIIDNLNRPDSDSASDDDSDYDSDSTEEDDTETVMHHLHHALLFQLSDLSSRNKNTECIQITMNILSALLKAYGNPDISKKDYAQAVNYLSTLAHHPDAYTFAHCTRKIAESVHTAGMGSTLKLFGALKIDSRALLSFAATELWPELSKEPATSTATDNHDEFKSDNATTAPSTRME
jgi:hypothetical protein